MIDFPSSRKLAGLLALCVMAGCASNDIASVATEKTIKTAAPIATPPKQVFSYTAKDRECLKRAMYFESQRSSREGLLAVGTVVINRLTSEAYPDTICDVVSQPRQFAPGVMTRKVHDAAQPELEEAADAILKGERNPKVKEAMFFHTHGLKFPYGNMHYVTVAGGNAFYEKRDRDGELQTPPPKSADEYILAYAPHMASTTGLNAMSDKAANEVASGAKTTVTQASIVAPEIYSLPNIVPLPAQRPLSAGTPSATMVAIRPEIWSLRSGTR